MVPLDLYGVVKYRAAALSCLRGGQLLFKNGFDDEMIRKEFFKSLRYPYLTNATPNKRHDGLNIARAVHAVDNNVLKTELNEKGNVTMRLSSLARMNGLDASEAHSAVIDASLVVEILKLIKKNQPYTWESILRTSNKAETENIIKKEKVFTLNEFFYGKSRLYLCSPLHPNACIHPVYQWGQAIDLRIDIKPLLDLSISDLKSEMKKTPKFLRTIRSNKAPVILDAKYGLKIEPYNQIDPIVLKERAEIIKGNENFSKKILTALREIAEEKQQLSSQEDIEAEESIYTKFSPNVDTVKFKQWHAASWKEKLNMLDKFQDQRLVSFGKKIIYQEAPEVLPEQMYKEIKRGIASRILSQNIEKWWTVYALYNEVDNLRENDNQMFSFKNKEEKLNFLNGINDYVMSVEKKYMNA